VVCGEGIDTAEGGKWMTKLSKVEKQLLRDPDVEPTNEVIAKALGDANLAYLKLIDELKRHDIQVEWRYYTDGKAWLSKGIYRSTGVRGGKKEITVFWLSIWEGFFRVTVYVPEKYREAVLALPLEMQVKQSIAEAKLMGKLKFFYATFDVTSDSQFDSILLLSDFKKRVK